MDICAQINYLATKRQNFVIFNGNNLKKMQKYCAYSIFYSFVTNAVVVDALMFIFVTILM